MKMKKIKMKKHFIWEKIIILFDFASAKGEKIKKKYIYKDLKS